MKVIEIKPEDVDSDVTVVFEREDGKQMAVLIPMEDNFEGCPVWKEGEPTNRFGLNLVFAGHYS